MRNPSGNAEFSTLTTSAPRAFTVGLGPEAATAVAAIKMGATDYLAKPADVDAILKALNATEVVIADQVSAGPMSVDRLEWEHIQRVLAENEGNISATARALKMHRRTLQRKLAKRPVKE